MRRDPKTPPLFSTERKSGTTRCVVPRSVRLSSPERVLFPDDGITKQHVFEYYRAIAPVLVPHLRNRPFTMKRSPYGVAGEAYFQKQAPKGMPSWIPTGTYRTYPREGGSRLVDFPLVNSPEAVLWMVQMNCIDMNAGTRASTSRTAPTSCSSTSTRPTAASRSRSASLI